MLRSLFNFLFISPKMSEVKPGDYVKVNKIKSLSDSQLKALSHEELIQKVQQLEAHNVQLKNLLAKKNEQEISDVTVGKKKKRSYNFKSCSTRHVLLKIFYLGWNSHGYVSQTETNNTIEYFLFHALEKCCLIEKRQTSNYQRCGRTDKGVSAFSQVISIDLRSKFPEPSPDNCEDELPYLTLINRLLPEFIKCYAWAHIDSNTGARFDCKSRSYLYYFPKGDLNIMSMKEGAKQLIGSHDFRNFCKMDVGNGVTKFIRTIKHADFNPCSDSEENDYKMYKLVITGNAFLWHQIRCIMSVLFLIGKGLESPDIIKELLDVEKNPNKPQYQMSDHTPLTLFDSDYDNGNIKWNICSDNLLKVIECLQKQWTFHSVKNSMIKEMIDELSKIKGDRHVPLKTGSILVQKTDACHHKPLLTRMKCASLQDRIEHYVKRRKIMKKEKSEEKLNVDLQAKDVKFN